MRLIGTFSDCGICHAYVDDPIGFKRQTGPNFPSHTDGVVLHERLLSLLDEKKIRTVIGQEFSFSDLPEAFSALAKRTAVGRSVILL